MEGNVFEVPFSIENMKSCGKAYRERQLTTIVAIICALLNSDGGKLNVKFEDDLILRNETDGISRMIEQRLVDIIGSCLFYVKVKVLKKNTKQLVFTVDSSQSLCTVDYNLYLPTRSQVIPISPWEHPERVKAILNREVRMQQQFENYEDFVLNRQVSFEESHSIQFKNLKSEKSKCVSLADRMTNKSNKLERYISAFGNNNGGRIFYGISDDGVVQGENIGKKDREEIIRKVTKTINQLIWPGGKLKRNRHWDIQFAPVKDKNQNELIPSLFVIIISVEPLRGGLFTQEPKSYHVVHSRLVRMTFTEWRRRFFADEQSSAVIDVVPSVFGQTKWNSEETQRNCHYVLQSLVKYQNDGDHYEFEKFAAFAQRRFQVTEVQLVILGERSAHAYKSGHFEKADSLIAKYESSLSKADTKDCSVFRLRAAYAKSAISRAKGDCRKSYAIAREGLQLAEMVPAGIITAWFYIHVAIVEKLLSQETKEEAERVSLVRSALDHYIKALQHSKASSVEQEFFITVADTQQRICIFRAVTLLGDFATGANFRKATPSDIKAAETDLSVCDRLILQGFKETKYRKIYHLFSLSDLLLCRWWQQQQTKEERSSEDYKTASYLLKQVFDYATEAKELSTKFHFPQLTNYARYRLAVIIEIMLKVKVSSLCHPKNRVNNN